jgi:hypothetical protein
MAAQRLSGRFIPAALVGGTLLIAGVVCASPAHADEASYLTHLHNIGVQGLNGSDASLVQTGRYICQQVSGGAPPQEMQSLTLTEDQARGLSPRQADAIVDYALVDLCPRA